MEGFIIEVKINKEIQRYQESILFGLSLRHLGLPLLYALIVPTLFSGWYYSHYALANGIWDALIVLGLISWAVSLVRKVRRML